MSTLSKMATDETFREVADLLFGGGADELISKMNPEGADLSSRAQKRKKQERTQAQVGLASNVIGLAAAVGGTKDAYQHNKGVKATKVGSKYRPPAIKVSRGTKALAAGALGLQVANVAGDAVANRVLARSAKKDPNVKGGAQTTARVATKKVQDIHKNLERQRFNEAAAAKKGMKPNYLTLTGGATSRGKLKPIRKSLNMAKDIPEAAGPGSGGKLTRVSPMQNPRQGKTAQKFAAGHFKKLPIAQGKQKIKKSAEVLDVKWEGEISKVNADKRQVFGWASIVELNGEPVVDLQGDYISIDEVEKSAYEYVHKSRKGGDMHLRDDFGAPKVGSHMIESMVVTEEKKKALGLPDTAPTGWWVGYQVNDDELWAKVRSGERTGFSIHGRGVRTPA